MGGRRAGRLLRDALGRRRVTSQSRAGALDMRGWRRACGRATRASREPRTTTDAYGRRSRGNLCSGHPRNAVQAASQPWRTRAAAGSSRSASATRATRPKSARVRRLRAARPGRRWAGRNAGACFVPRLLFRQRTSSPRSSLTRPAGTSPLEIGAAASCCLSATTRSVRPRDRGRARAGRTAR